MVADELRVFAPAVRALVSRKDGVFTMEGLNDKRDATVSASLVELLRFDFPFCFNFWRLDFPFPLPLPPLASA